MCIRDSTKRECRHIMLKLKSLAKDVEVDTTGRIMLPADAREKCGICLLYTSTL